MLDRMSATRPDIRVHAASRACTSSCRRRTSGSTAAVLSTIIPSMTATSSGSNCQSTTDANTSGSALATIRKASTSKKVSNCVANPSTRLVSAPAKFSWKNAASLASSSSTPAT